MPVVLDTRPLPRPDRIAAAAEFLDHPSTPSALAFDTRGTHLGHRLSAWNPTGGTQVVDLEGSGLRVTRRARHVRMVAPERLCLAIQLRGTGQSLHREVRTATPPGHLNLIDATSESDFRWSGLAHRRVLFVDYSLLGLPVDTVRSAVGRLPASPLHDLAASHLSNLRPEHAALRDTPAGAALASASLELVRALVVSAVEPAAARDTSARELLRLRVVDYIQLHLYEPDLDAASIARAHHVSVRHLYSVWSDSPVPLREWIIRARLDHAARRLRTHPLRPVAAVAAHCGFTNVTHFNRRFRDAFGMPPGEWRRTAATGQAPTPPTPTSPSASPSTSASTT